MNINITKTLIKNKPNNSHNSNINMKNIKMKSMMKKLMNIYKIKKK